MIEQVREQFNKLYHNDFELPDMLQQEYELLSCIKHTEQKQIYLLLQKNTGKKAVLKCGSGIYRDILKEEASRLAQLDGNGFPYLMDWHEMTETCFLVREYIEGETLQELMEKEEPLALQEALEAAMQVCGLLDKLHSQNPPVIYRDVKPQNIVRTPGGNYVLIDLDTARAYKEGAGEDTVFMGTRGIASPEQFGFQQTDARTDVYGVGMLLLYLTTGSYEKSKTYERLPERIKKIIAKCTEFNPKDRYHSMKEVERSLQNVPGSKGWQELLCKRKKMLRKIFLVLSVCLMIGGMVTGVFAAQYRKNIVEFSNPVIEKAVRERLGKTDGSAITKEELEGIYTLVICGERVFFSWIEHEEYMAFNWFVTENWTQPEESFDMSDLAMFTNLNTLVIEFQNVTEIPDLSHLPLVRVSFSNNSLTDISGLAGCTQIKNLLLYNNPISDITALQNLNQLEQLHLGRTSVSDLSQVNKDTVKALYVEFTDLSDYSVLQEFPAIEELRVANATKEEIEQLVQLSGLKNLSLFESEVDSLMMFQKMSGLQGLELAGCVSLTDMEGIEYLPELTFLGLAGTGIESFPEHFYHDKLQVLEVTGTGIKDFKSLLRCPKLRNLYVSESMKETASMQLGSGNIEITGIK